MLDKRYTAIEMHIEQYASSYAFMSSWFNLHVNFVVKH